ncbi:MAG: hypothetical protein LBK70_00335 [Clostridiales bacterium]|jgi:hypothetical protein|nr:hypothetical protein [Clostridiales bacterium]
MAGLLYTQGTQRLEIIVRKDASGGIGTKGLATDKASQKQQDGDLDDSIDESPKKKTLKAFAVSAGFQMAKQVAFFGFNYYVGGIGMKNGDQALQEQINHQYQMYRDTINVVTSVGSGAAMGFAVGNVPGAIIGGIFGAVSSGMSIAERQVERQRNYDYTVFKQNNEINFNRYRAGNFATLGRNK